MKERQKDRLKIFNRVLSVISGKPETLPAELEEEQYEAHASDPLDVRFVKCFKASGGKFIYCADQKEITEVLTHISEELELQNIFAPSNHSRSLLEEMEHPFSLAELEDSALFFADCEALVAYNGGVMVTSVQKGNKSLDQLPKEVIVLAYTDQLVDRLNEGLSLIREKYGKDIPTHIGTLHGPEQEIQTDPDSGRLKNLFLLLTERKA
jgi:L-lactate utilization protein LutC